MRCLQGRGLTLALSLARIVEDGETPLLELRDFCADDDGCGWQADGAADVFERD